MWEESQPGPSRGPPGGRGYCGYCRVLYRDLDQHLSSLRHLDAVQTSSREPSTVPSVASQSRQTLLERFLSDVLEHHPHLYYDSRPPHADLPPVSILPPPRAELVEVAVSDEDGPSPHLPTSDVGSLKVAGRDEGCSTDSQSGDKARHEGLPSSIREQVGRTCPAQHDAPPSQSSTQAPPSVHKKAHRKTNRRKASESSSQSLGGAGTRPRGFQIARQDPAETKPWRSWQRERREAQKEQAFSLDYSDPLDQTIEEVIQMCCHGTSSAPRHQEEAGSLHLSLPVSMETQSEEWDLPVQVVLQGRGTLTDAPVQMRGGRDLGPLMDSQVRLEDEAYSHRLDHALHGEHRAGGSAPQEVGFWTLPIEEVLPVPQHIPDSFRGKSWAEIEQEDHEKVEHLVRQFRRERFVCYFDSESLARYGRRSRRRLQEAEPDVRLLPLVEQEDGADVRRRSRRRRSFRLASRCQVVKVSRSTQTVRLVAPAVPEAPPTSTPAANQSAAERTPRTQMWRCLPPLYSNVVSPVQPHTSVVYLLCSPSGSAPTTPDGSAAKRCRRRRRPLELQRLKVTYKPLPVQFYDPGTNRILKNPPRGLARPPGTASGAPPPCVRQLFRSLSPDLNTGPTPAPDPKRDAVGLSALSRPSHPVRRRGRMPQAPPRRSERGAGTRQSTSKTRSSIQAPPRREGLRQAGTNRKLPGSACPPPSRRGKGRRGRGYKRTGR